MSPRASPATGAPLPNPLRLIHHPQEVSPRRSPQEVPMIPLSKRLRRLLAIGPALAVTATSGAFSGDCCSPNNSPGCDQPACVAVVCPLDPFCCTTEWDLLCALAAQELCDCGPTVPEICGASTNDCFALSSSPGCNDVECCILICSVDPACCSTEWDQSCVSSAITFCSDDPKDPPPSGCGEALNGCFESASVPGCSDATCCAIVCAADPFCCSTEWDIICVLAALDVCEPETPFKECPDASNPCTVASGAPGCSDPGCCVLVCNTDPICCIIGWDTGCVQIAISLCGLAPSCGTSPIDCFTAGTGPGCSDGECCLTVCAFDPSCCNEGWDQFCATIALSICAGGPPSGCGISTNDCFTVSPTPGCSDSDCCLTVCAVDPFCCATSWDVLCVQAAQSTCEGGEPHSPAVCGSATNGCFETGGPGCSDEACCQFICAQDPFCCTTAWDELCVAAATTLCVPSKLLESVCGVASHGCTTPGEPGCADATCCAMVCSYAPDCCEIAWDAMCVELALRGCAPPVAGDLNGDGIVNGADLALLLAGWGSCDGCAADLDANGSVDAADLAVLLSLWTI